MDPLLLSLNGDLFLQGEAMKELQNEMLTNIYSFFTDYYMDGFVASNVAIIWLGWIFQNGDEDHFYTDAIADRVITCSAALVFFLKYLNWPVLNVLRSCLHIICVLFSFTYTLGPIVLWLLQRISSIYNNRTGNKQQQCAKNGEQHKRTNENQLRKPMSREGSAVQREGSIGSEVDEHRENQLPTEKDNEVEAREESHQFAVPSGSFRLHSRSRSRSISRSAQPDTPKTSSPGKTRKSNRESPEAINPRRSQRIRTPTKQ